MGGLAQSGLKDQHISQEAGCPVPVSGRARRTGVRAPGSPAVGRCGTWHSPAQGQLRVGPVSDMEIALGVQSVACS